MELFISIGCVFWLSTLLLSHWFTPNRLISEGWFCFVHGVTASFLSSLYMYLFWMGGESSLFLLSQIETLVLINTSCYFMVHMFGYVTQHEPAIWGHHLLGLCSAFVGLVYPASLISYYTVAAIWLGELSNPMLNLMYLYQQYHEYHSSIQDITKEEQKKRLRSYPVYRFLLCTFTLQFAICRGLGFPYLLYLLTMFDSARRIYQLVFGFVWCFMTVVSFYWIRKQFYLMKACKLI